MGFSLWAQALPVLAESVPALFGLGAAGTVIGGSLQAANIINSLLSGSKQSTVDTLVDIAVDTVVDGIRNPLPYVVDRLRPTAERIPRPGPQPRPEPVDTPREDESPARWLGKKKTYRTRYQPF